ncbi:sensor histidine kinase [Nocardia terrae]|uniref:sensor histidine kinase n=1 Tax=Nocardia terrae TaxID=2675851 RepID=UPI0012FC4506|nr:histidine kinase [Nocardia terrae]
MTYHVPETRRTRWVAISVLWVLVLLWLVDWISVWPPITGRHSIWDWLLVISGPLFAALVVVPGRRLAVAWRAGLAAAGSWLLTVALAVFPAHDALWLWGFMETGALLILLGVTARRVQPMSLAVALCSVLGLAIIALPLRVADQVVVAAIFTIVMAWCVAIALILGGYVRSADMRRAQTVTRVQQAERLELARELHDFVAHHVTGIVVQAQAARTILATAPHQVDGILSAIETAGTETLDSMRRLVRVLREQDPRTVRSGELYAELADLVADFARGGGPEPTVRVTGAARKARLAPEVEVSVHRVVQESLTNVRRHAPGAALVTVGIDVANALLAVEVCNSAPAQRVTVPVGGLGGLGLVGLAERVQAVEGRFSAGPAVDGGWRVLARFPILDTVDG